MEELFKAIAGLILEIVFYLPGHVMLKTWRQPLSAPAQGCSVFLLSLLFWIVVGLLISVLVIALT